MGAGSRFIDTLAGLQRKQYASSAPTPASALAGSTQKVVLFTRPLCDHVKKRTTYIEPAKAPAGVGAGKQPAQRSAAKTCLVTGDSLVCLRWPLRSTVWSEAGVTVQQYTRLAC